MGLCGSDIRRKEEKKERPVAGLDVRHMSRLSPPPPMLWRPHVDQSDHSIYSSQCVETAKNRFDVPRVERAVGKQQSRSMRSAA